MLQDSLQHVALPVAEEPAAVDAAADSVVAPVRVARPVVAAADTVPTDPMQLEPLVANMTIENPFAVLENGFETHGIIRLEKLPFCEHMDSVLGTSSDSYATMVSSGMAGDPLPYRFKSDNIVATALLVSFFLVVWVISRSRRFLSAQLKDFFRPVRRENLFVERTQKELRGQVFLVFQTCFVFGLLFFDFTREWQTEVFNQVSPYKILGVSVTLCLVYYLLKIFCYSFVNAVFFTADQSRRWMEGYLLCILAQGLLFLPVVLLMIYFDLSFNYIQIFTAIVLIGVKILLFYKCSLIFFNYKLGWVHLFLYFCTLELMPLPVLYRALVYANNFLLTIN